MMMTGRIHGEHIQASRRHFDLSTLTPGLVRRMTPVVACLHCPETFTDTGMWNRYARHLRTEHR